MFFTRLTTAAVLFVVLFCIFYFGGGMFLGAEVGMKMAEKNKQCLASDAGFARLKQEVKQEADKEVAADIGTIALVAVVLSGLFSLGLTFGGALPWCRKNRPAVAGHSSGAMPDNTA